MRFETVGRKGLIRAQWYTMEMTSKVGQRDTHGKGERRKREETREIDYR